MIAMTQTLVEKCDLKKRRANNALCDEYGVESIDKLYKIDKGTEKSVKKKKKSYKVNSTCGVKFLFNPKSFTQTVENIFNVSFIVKHGQGEIGIRSLDDCKALGIDENENSIDDDDDPFRLLPGPYVKARDSKKKIKGSVRQAVVALNMRVSIRFCFIYTVLFSVDYALLLKIVVSWLCSLLSSLFSI